MILINICGASGSGKTALANNIVRTLNKCGVKSYNLALDNYYICYPELSFEERTKLNYDSPVAFDFELLSEDINKLYSDIPITTKKYDYSKHLRHDSDRLIYPPQVLILEGIHSFADKRIFERSDVKLYVDTDIDVCVVRRMCRDVEKRDRDVNAIANQYLSTVKPMFEKYIRLYRNKADVCVIGGGHNMCAVEMIKQYVLSIL